MKKTLIAVAALAATGAFAQTVSIKGTFDPSIANQKTTYGDGYSQTQNKLLNNSQGTSQITFFGEEDLGGGLKAIFLMENDFDAALKTDGANGTKESVTGGTAGTSNFGVRGGEQYAGLAGAFGSIKLGAANNPTLAVQGGASQPFGTKIGSGFGFFTTAHVRDSNSIVYATPVFSGFSVQVGYAFEVKDDANAGGAYTGVNTGNTSVGSGSRTDIGVSYANGPLAVAFTNYTAGKATQSDGTFTTKDVQNNLGVSYDFGVVKVGAGYFTEKQDIGGNTTAAIDRSAYNVSAVVPFTPTLALLANVGKRDDKTSANVDGTLAAVGLKYTLSKRTSVYARYVSYKNDNVATTAGTTAIAKQTTALVGLQTNF